MEVVRDYPPNYEAIAARFPVIRGKPILFAWGDRIYNPRGGIVSSALQAHEAVHGRRQGADIEGWWERYLEDDRFRFEEELAAHRAEYEYLIQEGAGNRQARRSAMRIVARRLASPMYGRLATRSEIETLLKGAGP